MPHQWSVHDAKQQFSRVLRAADEKGPQFVSRHGREVAVVVDIGTYRRLTGSEDDFKAFLVSGPPFDDLGLRRDQDPGRPFELDLDDPPPDAGFDEVEA